MKIEKIKPNRKSLFLLYGEPGVGKTTFGAMMNDVIFIRTEERRGEVEYDSFPLSKTYNDAMKCLAYLINNKNDHSYKTLVVDSISAFELMVWEKTCEEHNKSNIADFGYFQGERKYCLSYWDMFIQMCNQAIKDTSIEHVILISHKSVLRRKNPEGDDYEVVSPAIDEGALSRLERAVDLIGYAHSPVFTKRSDKESGQRDIVKARDVENKRVLTFGNNSTFLCKNTFCKSLPNEINLNAKEFMSHFK